MATEELERVSSERSNTQVQLKELTAQLDELTTTRTHNAKAGSESSRRELEVRASTYISLYASWLIRTRAAITPDNLISTYSVTRLGHVRVSMSSSLESR